MDTGAAVAVITFQPSQDQAVLVAAAAGRDAVEARLRPQRAVDRVVHLTSQRGAWVSPLTAPVVIAILDREGGVIWPSTW